MKILFCLFVSLLISGATGFGQSSTAARIAGTITDSSGAGVPDAKVTVTNTGTNATWTTVSGKDGSYAIPLLPPGSYDIRIERQGFSTQNTRGMILTLGQAATVDFALAVSAVEQVIEVQGQTPVVETERTHVSNTIDQQAVQGLPINRRDYLTFSLLLPGVNDSKALADSNTFRVKQTPDSGLSFYGSNGRGNSINVDGGEANDAGGGVRPTVSQETVQEFVVNRNNFTAEHGAARGGVVDIITRSGSNRFHGSAFSFFRHQSLDATNPFAVALTPDNRLERTKPDSNRQQFGATLGGPIVTDRSFFFLGYEQLRRREFNAVPVLTDPSIFQPTADQERILRGLPADAAAQLRPVLTSPPATMAMFRQNSGIFPFQTDQHQGLLRLDHQFNDRNQFNFRYNITKAFDTNPNLGALVGASRGFVQDFFDSTVLAGWTRVIARNFINEFRVQFNYYDFLTTTNDPYGPALEIAGFGFFNRDRFLPAEYISRREEIVDNVSITAGTHSLKFGPNILVRNVHSNSALFFSGRFTFGALPGALVSPALASTSINALQAFNLGLAQSYQQGFGNPIVRGTYPLFAAYFQDSWRVRRSLTLNYGVRWEADQRIPPLPTNKLNFAPRFGFAWSPGANKAMVVRGGYGIFYSTIDAQVDHAVNALNEIEGVRQIAQVLTVLSAANPLAINGPVNIFRTLRAQGVIGIPTPQRPILASDLAQFGIAVSQTGPRPPLSVLFRNSEDYRNPYAQQASLEIQRQIAQDFSVTAGYAYVRGVHLTTSRDDNLLPAPVDPALGIRNWGPAADNPTGLRYFRDPLLFQGNVYESTANSWYHGMTLEANKRFGNHFALAANYTWSKAIDETTDFNSDFQPNDQSCRRCDRALSAFDQRHKVVIYGVLQAPPWQGQNPVWKKLLANFGFAPIFRYNSARPFNLLAGTELNNDRHNTTDRPLFAGRNIGIGPSFWTFDARLNRVVRFTENRRLDFMFEAFNLFNKLNYATVNNTVGVTVPSGLHGRSDRSPSEPLGFTSAADPRRVQFGIRFSF